MGNIDMNTLMNMLSKMDKKELEEKMEQASQILNSKNPGEAIKEITKNNKHKN